MPSRRHVLIGAGVLAATGTLPAAVHPTAVAPVLAVPPGRADGDAVAARLGAHLLVHEDPIGAVQEGSADAAYAGHGAWRAAPPAFALFGGLPAGMPAAERDAWLADPAGRAAWNLAHAACGLASLPLPDPAPLAIVADRNLDSVPALSSASIAAPPCTNSFWSVFGTTLVGSGGLGSRPVRYIDDAAAAPIALVWRADRPPPFGEATRNIPPLGGGGWSPAPALPLEARIAIGNAAATWVEALAGSDVPWQRIVCAAFRQTRTPAFPGTV
ncbi:MAG TPA: hypothetical protein VEY95_08220 [Azospirillaceae bacterium]|nr:hypothetical protein [Azospirillaceae bacterium]